MILKHADPALSRDLRKDNASKIKYDQFWDIAQKQIDEMTAVNDRRHSAGSSLSGEVLSTWLSISAPDLYNNCRQDALDANLTENEIPSLSWFKFQFWPKDCSTHTALNYTGHGCFNAEFYREPVRRIYFLIMSTKPCELCGRLGYLLICSI